MISSSIDFPANDIIPLFFHGEINEVETKKQHKESVKQKVGSLRR
jgi:hypothetical protein